VYSHGEEVLSFWRPFFSDEDFLLINRLAPIDPNVRHDYTKYYISDIPDFDNFPIVGTTAAGNSSNTTITLFYNLDQAITPGVYTSEQQLPTTASAGGDPYVYPISGPPVKLPNMSASYRLYQDSTYIVNGTVSRASERIQSEINSVVEHTGLQAVSSEAFFFSVLRTIHVPSGEWFEIDLESKCTTMSSPGAKTMFVVGELELQNTHYAFEPDCDKGRSHVSFPIRLGPSTIVHIMFSRNPQVRNGLSLTTSTTNADGLLLCNYRPKLFQISSHLYDKPVTIPTGYRRVLTKRGVTGHQEQLMKIRVPRK
jgi:hypothetical protein